MRTVHRSQNWDHWCIAASKADVLTKEAQKLGDDGWELAAAASTPEGPIWCFKRPQGTVPR